MKLPGKTISIKQSDSPPRNNAKSQSQIIPSPVLHKAEHDCTFKIKFLAIHNQDTCSSFFFRFFSRLVHFRVLGRVSCAVQQVTVSHLFYIQQCVYVSPIFPVHLLPPNLPLPLFPGNHKLDFHIHDSTSVL